jgi:hypothetical protein
MLSKCLAPYGTSLPELTIIHDNKFIREWHQNYREDCPEGLLDKDTIIKIYDEILPCGNSKEFVDQIFRIFDKDGDGYIDFKEFMLATDMTASGSPEEKLRWAFKVITCQPVIYPTHLLYIQFIYSNRDVYSIAM